MKPETILLSLNLSFFVQLILMFFTNPVPELKYPLQ